MNINSAIKEGAKILKNKFIVNPYLDSEVLMAKVINKNREYIKTFRLIIMYSLPVVIPTGFEFLFGLSQIGFGVPEMYMQIFDYTR